MSYVRAMGDDSAPSCDDVGPLISCTGADGKVYPSKFAYQDAMAAASSNSSGPTVVPGASGPELISGPLIPWSGLSTIAVVSLGVIGAVGLLILSDSRKRRRRGRR